MLKGEHALWVIAPRTARAAEESVAVESPLSVAVAAEADDPRRSRIVGWRGQAVFDVSQTEGEPLLVPRGGAEPVKVTDTEGQELWASLVNVAEHHGFAVEVSDSQRSLASGYTNFGAHLISLGEWLDTEERLAVLAHELGHVMLHGPDDQLGQLYGSSTDHRGLAEVQAESVAYTVLKAHGIDRGPQSSSYLAGWADAVLVAEADSILQSAAGCKLLSRTDIAKSVLARVSSAAKCILEVTSPAGPGGRVSNTKMEVETSRSTITHSLRSSPPGAPTNKMTFN